jgi:hypothetical protein
MKGTIPESPSETRTFLFCFKVCRELHSPMGQEAHRKAVEIREACMSKRTKTAPDAAGMPSRE